MERKAARGAKPKNVPPPGNLITLGNKSVVRSDAEKSTNYPMNKTGGKLIGLSYQFYLYQRFFFVYIYVCLYVFCSGLLTV